MKTYVKNLENRYQELFENSTVGIVTADVTGRILDVNQKICEILKYPKEELLNKIILDISHPEDIKKEMIEVKKVLSNKKNDISMRKRYFKKDGDIVWCEMNSRVVRDSDGNIDYVFATIIDITKQVEAENIIKEDQKQLIELNATKDKFFSIIAHDLRNPYNAILGFSELTLLDIKNREFNHIKEYIEMINLSAQEGVNLLNNLLEWSRIQTGRIKFNPQIVDLKSLISKIISLFKPAYIKKDINLDIYLDPELTVYADMFMLETVIRNLISNGIKFTPKKGSITIKGVKNGDCVEISIIDSGVGMDKKSVDKLFKIESHYSTYGTENESGTGLGLILSKEFINKHGGTISVKSEKNIGSTFSFKIKSIKN